MLDRAKTILKIINLGRVVKIMLGKILPYLKEVVLIGLCLSLSSVLTGMVVKTLVQVLEMVAKLRQILPRITMLNDLWHLFFAVFAKLKKVFIQ